VAVEIVLAGTYAQGSILRRRSPARMLDDIAAWWQRHAGEFEPRIDVDPDGDPPSLALALHPAVEPAIFEVPSPGTLVISANTSTGGPGYHRTFATRVRRMARDLSVDWPRGQLVEGLGDETGFFETGDGTAVDAAMLDWAHDLAEAVLEQADGGGTDFAIGMAPEQSFRTEAFAKTALGPRDRAFFERIVADRSAGAALFPWWADGPDADFHRDRALTRMWTEVRWRAPLDDADRETLSAVDRDLQRAATAGSAGIPWAAWDEIRGLLGRAPADRPASAADVASPARIGYRRGLVGFRYHGWVLDVPGSMGEATVDGDHVVYDETGNIRISTFQPSDEAGDGPPADAILAYGLMDGRLTAVIDDEGVVGWASTRPLDGDDAGFRALQGLAAAPGALAFVTISHTASRADWAATTFRTLRWKPLVAARADDDAELPPGSTWTPDERDRVLVQAGLTAMLRDPRTPRYVIVERSSWVSSGYVQAIVDPAGGIRVELAGARNDPSMADPERLARAQDLGWGPAEATAAGNHVIVCAAPVDLVALSGLIVRTLREVHATPVGGLQITIDEAGPPPR
jgi:hypothetical protein